ncbi:MAG: TldD/PmbA family protein [Acidobacteria bacterium]|nr:TldD/PmbA family protein [Acidobacteriota bacterium]
MLSSERCQEIFSAICKYSDADETELLVAGGTHNLTRFANNTIHQNVAEEGYVFSVRTVYGGRTARATTNRFDAESLQRVVAESASLARQQQPDPELLPMPGPQTYQPVERYFEATGGVSPQERAQAVLEAIRVAEASGYTAAGAFSTGAGMQAMLNSRGLAAYYRNTHAEFSVTMLGQDSTGWAKKTSPDAREIRAQSLAARAAEIASRSHNPRELVPGQYVTILEAAAVLDLVGFLFFDFSGQAVRDKRSFLTDRLGQKLFGNNIHISDNVYHPLQFGPPFDGEGVSRKAIPLVENGVIRGLAYSRKTAHAMGTEPTGHGFPLPNEWGEAPTNIVFSGGPHTVAEMVAATERGILITRLWYIREVDPYRKILTGMTRDGTFLVEDGQIRCGIRNFRFNESLLDLLQCAEMLGQEERASGEESAPMVVPPLKVSAFHFTEVTKF